MTSLAVAFITIHLLRKSKRYQGYRTTANQQLKQLPNLNA